MRHRSITVLLVATLLIVAGGARPTETPSIFAQRTLPPFNKLTTLAGLAGQQGSSDAVGSEARFRNPSDVSINPDGRFALVADSGSGLIRRVDIATAEVTTLATLSGLQGIAISNSGTFALIAVSEQQTIMRLDLATNSLSLVAGKPGEIGSDDGPGLAARFNRPYDIAISSDDSFVLIPDANNFTIRRLDLRTSAVTTIAGQVGRRGFADGQGAEALFNTPVGVTLSPDNRYLLVADNAVIRTIDLADNRVTTIAGLSDAPGITDGLLADARFDYVHGIQFSPDGSYALLTDYEAYTVRRIDLVDQLATTLVGLGGTPGSDDGIGSAARLFAPRGIDISSDGSFALVADTTNHTVRLLTTPIDEAQIGTLAGSTGQVGAVDGFGSAVRFNRPVGVSSSDNGYVAIADSQNHLIRLADLRTNEVTTLAGAAGQIGSTDGTTTTARFNDPLGVSISRDGNTVLVADTANATIRLIDRPSGTVRTIAGIAGQVGAVDGSGTTARFNKPLDVELSADGSFALVADSANHTIRRVTLSNGRVTTVAGLASVPGNTDGVGPAARFNRPVGVSLSRDNSFALIADEDNGAIRQLILDTGEVRTIIAGLPTVRQRLADFGSEPVLNVVVPCDVGTALVSSGGDHVIELLDLGTRRLLPLLGSRGQPGAVDGYGEAARFNRPTGLGASCYNEGTVVVGDTDNQLVREVDPVPEYIILLPFVLDSKVSGTPPEVP
jgi:DNA-binding beta-propeller fold protein YncE